MIVKKSCETMGKATHTVKLRPDYIRGFTGYGASFGFEEIAGTLCSNVRFDILCR